MYISVIIPVYNAIDTIERAVNSILSQSFKNFEIIIIDDGSEDGSSDVIKSLAITSSKIRIISIPNSGVSAARNRGIQEARGKYIMFLDSDDLLHSGILELVHQHTIEFVSDVFIFGFELVDEYMNSVSKYSYSSKKYYDKTGMAGDLAYVYICNQLNMVWNKAFRTAWVKEKQLLFKKYQYGEDRLFVFDSLSEAEKVEISDVIGYSYVVSLSGSLISNFNTDKFCVCCLIDEQIRSLISDPGPVKSEELAILDYMFIKCVISCFVQLHDRTCSLSFKEKLQYISKITNHPNVRRKRVRYTKGGLSYVLLSGFLRTRLSLLNYFSSYTINKVKNQRPSIFVRIKHR